MLKAKRKIHSSYKNFIKLVLIDTTKIFQALWVGCSGRLM